MLERHFRPLLLLPAFLYQDLLRDRLLMLQDLPILRGKRCGSRNQKCLTHLQKSSQFHQLCRPALRSISCSRQIVQRKPEP